MGDGARFPNHFPTNCPPPEARTGPQEVYRVVKEFPVIEEDFRTAYDRGAYKNRCQCLRRGLSCLQTIEDARHCTIALPHLGHVIVRGTIGPTHGSLLETKGMEPSHTTWWVATGVDPLPLFSFVEDANVV